MAAHDSDSDLELEIEGDDQGTGAKTLLAEIKQERERNGGSHQPTEQKPQTQTSNKAHETIDKLFAEYQQVMPYVCKLILEDIGGSDEKQDTNKSYFLQVLHKQEGDSGLLCKWSNTGGNLDYSFDKVTSLEDAISLFKDKFFEKTFNNWDQREIFRAQPGAYKWLGFYKEGVVVGNAAALARKQQENQKIKEKLRLIADRTQTQTSGHPREVITCLMQLFDLQESEFVLDQYHVNKAKLGMIEINMRDILAAHKILADLEYQIFSPSRKNQVIFELSAEFASLVPQTSKASQNQMIDDIVKLRRAYALLQVQASIYYQISILKDLSYVEHSLGHPLDEAYLGLNSQLRVVSAHTETAENIRRLLTCHGQPHQNMKIVVREILEIQKEGAYQNFHPFRKLKRRWLWVGGSSARFVEILHRGFNIIKSESSSSGTLFGKAIHATDVASKAAKQCAHDYHNKFGFLLLCDVAVGREYVVDRSKPFSKPPSGYHSVKGQGKFESNQHFTWDGAVCSEGTPVEVQSASDSTLQFNEFAIFDDGQIRPAYLLRFEINY